MKPASPDPRTLVATTALAAGAAAVGMGLATAAPAAAQPKDPVTPTLDNSFTPTLPTQPFAAHDSASTRWLTQKGDRFLLGDPYDVFTGAFKRFTKRFEAPGLGDTGASVNSDTSDATGGP